MSQKVKKPISKKRLTINLIVCSIVAVICIVGIILANYFINYYSVILHAFFAGDMVDTSAAKGAFENADIVVRDAADDSMVLLENKDDYLPKKDLKKVNLFGWGSTEYGFLLTGGGSGGRNILPANSEAKNAIKVDINDAFTEADIEYNTELYNAYCAFSKYDADYRSGGSTGKSPLDSLKNPGADWYTEARMNQAYEYSHVAVAVLSRWGSENGGELKSIGDYPGGSILKLTTEEKAMFDKLEEKGFEVIVVFNTTNFIEPAFIRDYSCIKAAIYAGIPGQSGVTAIPKIIKGDVNPSGRLNDTLPYSFKENNPTYDNATYVGTNIVYQEGIYFGYKWYETADAEGYFNSVSNKYGTGYTGVVMYPFGFGLSYTSFDWDVTFPNVASDELTKDGEYEVTVEVTNSGTVAGKDVVQLYGHVDYVNGGIEKPERTLLDFAKTGLIEPGESDTVTLKFSSYDLASYDEYDKNGNDFKGYELECKYADSQRAKNVEISVMRNAHDKVDEMSKKYAVNAHVNATPNQSIQYSTDPVTGTAVVNRFTGNTAYANVPIDGSTAYDNLEYLSRKDHFANYNKLAAQGVAKESAVNAGVNYLYDGYNNKAAEVAEYNYGVDSSLYLVGVKNGEDENATISKATLEMLTGKDSSVTLGFETWLLEELNDYDSELWPIFLDQLTQAEIRTLIGMGGFRTETAVSVGKPFCTDKDGPAGFNNNVSAADKPTDYTLFPAETLIGCSWSKEIAYAWGEAQGKIGSDAGIQGWYGPGVNLHRSYYNSRNYEYFSEDAVLSGKLAAQVITGARDNNVYTYLKHMAVSEAGQNPKEWNTWLTEQNMRENYLKPFEIAVKEGKSTGIMSAFNRIGSVLCAYNHAMLTDILRNEWGFRGTVITDWFEGNGYASDHIRGILGGNDLWLCGTTSLDAPVDFNNTAQAYAARISAKNILYTFINTNLTASSIKVNEAPYSPLLIALWTLINVVLALGILVCLFFIIISIPPIRRRIPILAKKDKRRAEAVAAANGGNVNADVNSSDGAASDEPAAEPEKEQPTEQPEEKAAEQPAEKEAEPQQAEEVEPEKSDDEKPQEEEAPHDEQAAAVDAPKAEEEKAPAKKPATTGTKSTAAKKPATTGTKSTAAKKPATTGTKSTAAKKPATTGTKSTTASKSKPKSM